MKTITIEFLNEQKKSLKKEIESHSRNIDQAYGAIRLIDFIIAKETQEEKKDVSPGSTEGQPVDPKLAVR